LNIDYGNNRTRYGLYFGPKTSSGIPNKFIKHTFCQNKVHLFEKLGEFKDINDAI